MRRIDAFIKKLVYDLEDELENRLKEFDFFTPTALYHDSILYYDDDVIRRLQFFMKISSDAVKICPNSEKEFTEIKEKADSYITYIKLADLPKAGLFLINEQYGAALISSSAVAKIKI
ncbi:hypothetical protein D3C71_1317400 [compost metagenome]